MFSLFAKTATRVEESSAEEVNAGIRERTKARIARYAAAPEVELRDRLEALDYEWDIERMLEANAAGVVLLGLLMGRTFDRRWYALSGAAGVFLMQHVLQGWCPPVSLFRRLGIRTAREIEHERNALLTALRSRTQAEEGWVRER